MSEAIDNPDAIILNLGGRNYELVPFIDPGKPPIDGDEMMWRAEMFEARLTREDVTWVFQHMYEIPTKLRRKIVLVDADRPFVSCLNGFDRKLVQDPNGRLDQWHADDRLLKRV